MVDTQRTLFKKCLEESVVNGSISSAVFFANWFRRYGTPYFFLFRKNLRATNIQVAELIALLRCNVTSATVQSVNGLNFMSSTEFIDGLDRLAESFSKTGVTNDVIECLADYAIAVAHNTIVCDIYFGSCLVFLPPGLECNWGRVCSHSGYIYACGPSILFRNINKATRELLYESIDTFLKKRAAEDRTPLRFVIYTHEDFTKHDRSKAAELQNGLDDLKIFVEKYYIGTERLVSVLRDLETRYDGRLHVMEAGPFHKVNQEARTECDPHSSLWLLVDHGVKDIARLRTDDQYLICYHQTYYNESPLHIFDENKPAWIDHTTIPHTLMGAMMNLTAPWWPKDRKPVVGDPFVGTGTTWLEAAKYNLPARCSDLLRVADLLCEDNARFFCLSTVELQKLSHEMEEAEKISMSRFIAPEVIRQRNSRAYEAKKWLFDMQALLRKQQPGELLSKDVEAKLRKQSDILYRMLLYVALRTGRRHLASFIRESEDWEEAYKIESSGLRKQVDELIDLYTRMADSRKEKDVLLFSGEYSYSACPNILDVLSRRNSESVAGGTDVKKFKKKSCDVIITDPPYGFNTDMRPEMLAKLLQKTIGIVLDALKDEGQLVIALPDWSHTGRELPFFILKEMFTQQLLSAASARNMEIVGDNRSLPPPSWLLKPPYYWESARALRRSILHFRFQRAKTGKKPKQLSTN